MKKILILDFGSQYSRLIARRIRAEKVYCEIHPWDWPADKIVDFSAAGIILSGGPNSVDEEGAPVIARAVFDAKVPLLAICYGMQAMARQLGGAVCTSRHREYGQARVRVLSPSRLWGKSGDVEEVWMSHGDTVIKLPKGFSTLMCGESQSELVAAMGDEDRRWYGVQFHPEVTHTQKGQEMLSRFVHEVCGIGHEWQMPQFIDETVRDIKMRVGSDRVVLGLSGGVDSSVAAVLIHRAIGEQLTCIFVDNGLLRQDEFAQVQGTLGRHLGLRIHGVQAADEFLLALAGVEDPEQKRQIIGRIFVEIFQREAATIGKVKWLAQGTIYPDVIESSSAQSEKQARTIKSHHNVGGLPDTLHLKLLEPLNTLFKDEVREVGLALGLPREMIHRHPFPGPGLGVRVLAEVRREYVEILRKADAIFMAELRAANWYDKVSQAFCVFLPVRSVGVMGDGRTYEHVIALRAVETQDFMTATWAQLPYTLLQEVARRIINEVPGINRVVYDISSKPPATIEWE